MRTKNAIKNIYFTIFQKIVDLILLFIQRTVFIKVLSLTYLGVSGLFSNIFTIFSLMELGVGSSIIFLLYKPIAEKNNEEITKLMVLYKKFYNYIGISILTMGLILMPFLKYIVDINNSVPNIYIIYLLTLLATSTSYFFSYKRSLLEADQKLYVSNFNIFIFNTFATLFRIIVLLLFKNYLLMLLVTLIMSFASNIVISSKVSKMYSYIDFKKKFTLKEYNIKPIISRMFAVSMSNIGNVVLTGTDNVIMSTFFGLSVVGIYSNYYMFTNIIYTTISWLFVSVTASVGNLKVSSDNKNSEIIFKRMNFINYYFYFISCIMLFCFINQFISLWIGSDFLFSDIISFVIVMNLFITGMRHTNVTFINASGLYYNIKYKPIFESIINLTLSIVLAKQLGVIGIFIGTFVSLFSVSTWIEPYILYKEWFKKDSKEYYFDFLKKLFLLISSMVIFKYLINYLKIVNYFSFFLYLILIFIIINVIFITIFHRKDEFKYYKGMLKDFLIKFKNRIKKPVN